MKKVVLLTGASSGIGKRTATLLAEKGYTVYGTVRKEGSYPDLGSHGIKPVVLDVTDDSSMVSAVEQILAIEKRIDILVNNAGFGLYGAVEDVAMESARYQLEVNVIGVARLIQLVLPSMRSNRSGKIINISSGAGRFSTPYGGWYHASKYALEGLSDALRNEVKQFGIDVVIVEPGSVKSEFSGIALDNLVKSSKDSAYKDAVERVADSYKKMEGNDSDPIVIAKLVLEGAESSNPKIRYVGGFGLKPTLIMKWLLSDKLFDKFLKMSLKF